jgi:hypothetical protein
MVRIALCAVEGATTGAAGKLFRTAKGLCSFGSHTKDDNTPQRIAVETSAVLQAALRRNQVEPSTQAQL